MENLDEYLLDYIFTFLNYNEILTITSLNNTLRFNLNTRKALITRILVHKVYQEGIRDGFGLFLDNIGLGNLPENNINGFLWGDTPNVTDPWYNSIKRIRLLTEHIHVIGDIYNK